MLLFVTVTSEVSAQRKGYYPVYRHIYRPRIYVSPFTYGLGYGNPYFGYPYYGYPYGYNYGHRRIPYKLELQVQSIRDDYQNRIRTARKDKSLSHSQRRQEIRNLKAERDQEIINAKLNFSRSSMKNRSTQSDNTPANDVSPSVSNS